MEKKNHSNSWLTHIHVENGYVLVSTVVRFHLIIQQRLLDALSTVGLFNEICKTDNRNGLVVNQTCPVSIFYFDIMCVF